MKRNFNTCEVKAMIDEVHRAEDAIEREAEELLPEFFSDITFCTIRVMFHNNHIYPDYVSIVGELGCFAGTPQYELRGGIYTNFRMGDGGWVGAAAAEPAVRYQFLEFVNKVLNELSHNADEAAEFGYVTGKGEE